MFEKAKKNRLLKEEGRKRKRKEVEGSRDSMSEGDDLAAAEGVQHSDSTA